MKARRNYIKERFSSAERKAINEAVNRRIEKRLNAERDIFSLRVIGTVCVVDHELFGHGKKRLMRKLAKLTDELNDRDNWGETSDEVLAKNLKAIGLDDYADELLAASERIDKAIEEFWEG